MVCTAVYSLPHVLHFTKLYLPGRMNAGLMLCEDYPAMRAGVARCLPRM